tara:strand:- start:19694 stop:20746 length:1053 start_codon:yes stop_codon:yes gene_type:complete
MRVLLTGGAGFIGSHTALLLLQRGYDVVIFDSFVNSSIHVIEAIEYYLSMQKIDYKLKTVKGDIRDKSSLDKLFKDSINEQNPILSVIHFAGLKSVSESVNYPLKYWDVNVCGTKNLLEIMSDNKCHSIVFSSSATIYGLADLIPIKENVNVSPINPYGVTKVAIENMLNDLYKANINSWKITSLRYFNPVGAHPSGFIGEDPIGIPSNLFPYITQVAIGRRDLLKVFGNDWDTKDGSGIRDYIHIMDLAEGHIAALDYLQSNQSCLEFINLGSGNGYSVFEIINEFMISSGANIPYEIKKRREGDIAICIADITKAKDLLGWVPKQNLKQMCLDCLKWQRKNPQGYAQK